MKQKHLLEISGELFPVLFTRALGDADKLPEEGDYQDLMEDGYCDEGEVINFMRVSEVKLDGKEIDIEEIDVVMMTDYLRSEVRLEEPFYAVQGNEEYSSNTYEIEIEGDINIKKIRLGIMAGEVIDYLDHLVCQQVWYDNELLKSIEETYADFDDLTLRLYDFDNLEDLD